MGLIKSGDYYVQDNYGALYIHKNLNDLIANSNVQLVHIEVLENGKVGAGQNWFNPTKKEVKKVKKS